VRGGRLSLALSSDAAVWWWTASSSRVATTTCAVERRLALEAMGRHSNLILLDGEGRITDCLRRVDGDMSARRQVLPGLFYRSPPPQAKLDPTALDRGELERLLAAAPPQAQADQWLLDAFGGLSPLVCRELACRAGGSTDARLDAMGQEGRRRLLDGWSDC